MKKLLALFFGLGFLSQQALAVTTVLGEEFAGYVDTVNSYSAGVWVDDTGSTISTPIYSNTAADISANITDMDAGSWVIGNDAGAYLDLSFNAGVVDMPGVDDLKIFFVGIDGQTVSMTIGTETQTFSLPANSGDTGVKDSLFDTFAIVGLGIDLSAFSSLVGPVTQFRLTIGDRWCGDSLTRGTCSAVPSFIGAYNAVPVPAAVWLFGSGLIGLVSIARRKK